MVGSLPRPALVIRPLGPPWLLAPYTSLGIRVLGPDFDRLSVMHVLGRGPGSSPGRQNAVGLPINRFTVYYALRM